MCASVKEKKLLGIGLVGTLAEVESRSYMLHVTCRCSSSSSR